MSMETSSGWISPEGEFYTVIQHGEMDASLGEGWIRVRFDNAWNFIGIELSDWEQPQISFVIEYISQFKDEPHLHLYIEDIQHNRIFDGQVGDFLRHETLAGLRFSWEPKKDYNIDDTTVVDPNGNFIMETPKQIYRYLEDNNTLLEDDDTLHNEYPWSDYFVNEISNWGYIIAEPGEKENSLSFQINLTDETEVNTLLKTLRRLPRDMWVEISNFGNATAEKMIANLENRIH